MAKSRTKGMIGRRIHRIANSSPARKLKTGAFYAPMAVAGVALAEQISRIDVISDSASKLESFLTQVPYVGPIGTTGAEIAGAALLLGTASLMTKKERKAHDFRIHELESEHLPTGKRIYNAVKSHGRNVLIAAGAGALILGASDSAPEILDSINTGVQGLAGRISEGFGEFYKSVFVDGNHWYNAPAKVAGALGLVALATGIHSRWSSTKHEPIKKTYTVDGYMPVLRWTAGENIKQWIKSRKLKIWRSEGMNLVRDDLRITADVFVYDYKSREEKHGGKIMFDPGLEPQISKREMTDLDVANIRHILVSKATEKNPDAKVYGKDVEKLVREARVYDALVHHFKQSESKNPPTLGDVNSVLQVLQRPGYAEIEISAISDSTLLQERKNTHVYQHGGRFHREFWAKDSGGAMIMLANLGEDSKATDLQSKSEYGQKYLANGKVCGVLAYRTFRAHGETGDQLADEDDPGQDHEHVDVHEVMSLDDHAADEFMTQAATNQVRQIRKHANTFVEHGLGRMFSMQYNGRAYSIEQEWVGSLPLAPGRALRRKFYVRDSTGEVVAKMHETWGTLLGKPFGNINWKVDVYSTDLAKNDGFGSLLCLMTDYLTHSKKYTENRTSDLVNSSRGGFEATLAGR